MNIRKDDNVLVITGKDKGKKGKVRYAYPKSGRLLVEGVNFVKRHTRPTGQATQQAGIIEREEPVNVSDVMLICGKCNKATRIGHRQLDAGKVRVCRACGEVID